jgi:hypothetical protein
MTIPKTGGDEPTSVIEAGDHAVSELRRQLGEPGRVATFRGQPAARVDPGAVSDLIDADVALRRGLPTPAKLKPVT